MTPSTTTTKAKQLRPDRPLRGERRARAAGGPQDQALYRCGCGHAFAGKVTTNVACPRCGSGQDW